MSSSLNQQPRRYAGHSVIRALADRVGIVASYTSMEGDTVETSVETLVALLGAIGFDASTETAAARELKRYDTASHQLLIDPVLVLPIGDRRTERLRVRLPRGVSPKNSCFHVAVTLESGEQESFEVPVSWRRGGTVGLHIPRQLGLGYHTIDLRVIAPGMEHAVSQRRIVHPSSCRTVESVLGQERAFGIWANLYSIRSDRYLGIGDLTDLAHLMDWAKQHGAEFVGINPLHSLRNRGDSISPYTPLSRLYRNEIYLDIAAVPEFGGSSEARAALEAAEASGRLQMLRASDHVQYEAVAALKLTLLRMLYETFTNGNEKSSQRRKEFSAYKLRAGKDLIDYATFRVLEQQRMDGGRLNRWQEWPERLRHPDAQGIDDFRGANANDIDFFCYVQFELERQYAMVSAEARSMMSIGLYGDLALGSDPTGADAWTNQKILVDGAHIGAPPDDFAVEGQDWGLQPMSPDALRASGYDYWIKLLRSNMLHTGALRLDHVMGLFRQYWIPKGMPGSMGSYVKFPSKDLLGILALESSRNNTIVVGEDLGTVPRGFQSLLARWGILSSRVLYFERGHNQVFRPRRAYSCRAMVTANTHDLVPLAGFWDGRDLELRRDAGGFLDTEGYQQACEQRQKDQVMLRRLLARIMIISAETGKNAMASLTRAAYLFLAGTPAPLLGVSLDDLAGEEEPVNLPGISNTDFRSWSRKIRVSLEELARDPQVIETLVAVKRERLTRVPNPSAQNGRV